MRDAFQYESGCIHEDAVDRIKKEIPGDETAFDLADLFKVFGDSTRIKILSALLKGEMCVCDLSAVLSMSQSAVSHQLRNLKTARLVKFRREGKVIYYSLDDDHVHTILSQGLEHLAHG